MTDYTFILSKIEELAKVYRINEVAFDRWGAASIVTALQEKNIPVADFGQGYASMNAPMKEVERLVGSQKLVHPENPVLTWCLSNVVVSMDPAGNLKPNKERSGEKIDGVVAMAMAIGRILARQPEPYLDIRIF